MFQCVIQDASFDWTSVCAVVVALIVGIASWYTAHTNNKLNHASVMLELIRREEENRASFSEYKNEINEINKWIESKSGIFSFNEFYEELSLDKYKHLRQIMYFYEELGLLVRKHQVSFKQVFSLIYFPDELSTQIRILRSRVILYKPDFMENYDYLYKRYEKERKKY